jgi:hypothetical protein
MSALGLCQHAICSLYKTWQINFILNNNEQRNVSYIVQEQRTDADYMVRCIHS